ncbi:hypothetical protein DFJ73DRAFT_624122 [Zopfochytrium polystomum]|nr:hypothetical protein DFJ73DRAFT_624122 [Zopfochytrium polystomum]
MADADADGPPQQPKAVVGPGLRVVDRGGREGPVIVATKAGALRTTETVNGVSAYFVENMQRRYTPQQNEPVIGIITARMAESYRVDIGGAHPASLNYLAFEGATKRNRPQLEVGAVVYARVSLANKDMEPELECVSAATGKADGFGELKDGWVARCSLGLGRSLLRRTNPFLQALGAEMPFEVAAGSNGRVWVKAGNAKNTILAVRTLLSSEGVSGDKARELLRSQQKRLEDATGES